MAERCVSIDHSTVNRWVIKYSPQLEEVFHRCKRSVWTSWRLDETYIKVKGEWKYLYRAVDKYGKIIDFLLAAKRDEQAAKTLQERMCDENKGIAISVLARRTGTFPIFKPILGLLGSERSRKSSVRHQSHAH